MESKSYHQKYYLKNKEKIITRSIEWAKNNKETVAKWTQSINEAKEFIDKNGPETRSILGKYTNLPPAVTEKIPLPYYDSAIKPSQIEVWVKALRDLGTLNLPVDANKIVFKN